MKISTFGSCLSNFTARNLCAEFGWQRLHCLNHNRSDAFRQYFIDRDRPQIPLEHLESILIPKADLALTADLFLKNQYDAYLGFHELRHLKQGPDHTFFSDLDGLDIDVILLDNLNDAASLLMYPNNMPGYEDSGLFLNGHFYENEDEISEKFSYRPFLTPAQSIENWLHIIRWLKAKQPYAKIFFLPYHSFTSTTDPERQARIDAFAFEIEKYQSQEGFEVIPNLSPPEQYTNGPEDWPHFRPEVYKALAGYIYLRTLNALPQSVRGPATARAPIKPQLECAPNPAEKIDNPYSNLPASSFWRRAVSGRRRTEIDPVIATGFKISDHDQIATAGSCFAQHISNMLVIEGFQYLVTEVEPLTAQALNENYGMFPARFGNIYSTRQLLQLFRRSLGDALDTTCVWQRSDGKFIDGFRPNIQAPGFETAEGLLIDRQHHLQKARDMFVGSDVFIFTLGLTETWQAKASGVTVPFAPGAVQCISDEGFEFENLSVQDCINDLGAFVRELHGVNPSVKVILTVSPVPLIATYEPNHVLTSTTYSKSVLRVAAQEICQAFANVDYFPSYEIMTGTQSEPAFFQADLREPTEAGVEYVMKTFKRHYMGQVQSTAARAQGATAPLDLARYQAGLKHIICDEDLLDRL